MRHLALKSIAAVLLLIATPVLAEVELSKKPTLPEPYVGEDARPVDLVICLDNSGSMTRLIDGVRAGLWDVVNEFGAMRPAPALRVGLMTYGSQDSTAAAGWVVQRSDLTHDLDMVYEKLMQLPPGRDEEYVGWALRTALETMSWSKDRDALKIIFIAGNESADQGVEMQDFRQVAQDARREDIIVNAIFAGDRANGVRRKWFELAEAGAGQFSAVKHLEQARPAETPLDATLEELNAALMASYVPYGPRGQQGLANQKTQDSNAAQFGPQSFASRVAVKSGPLYNNPAWDLVDAASHPGFDWNEIAREDLPEELRGMGQVDLILYVDEKGAAREQLRRQILETNTARAEQVRSATGQGYASTLDVGDTMINAVRAQAEAKGFTRDR